MLSKDEKNTLNRAVTKLYKIQVTLLKNDAEDGEYNKELVEIIEEVTDSIEALRI